jgi:hypothetical protein
MTDLVALSAANVHRWNAAKLTRSFAAVAKKLISAKARYQTVEAKIDVPCFIIA